MGLIDIEKESYSNSEEGYICDLVFSFEQDAVNLRDEAEETIFNNENLTITLFYEEEYNDFRIETVFDNPESYEWDAVKEDLIEEKDNILKEDCGIIDEPKFKEIIDNIGKTIVEMDDIVWEVYNSQN